MKLPRILVVDDLFARDATEKELFFHRAGLVEVGINSGSLGQEAPVAEVVLCSGQRVLADRVENDYEVIRSAVCSGGRHGEDWSLLFLDVNFDSGEQRTLGYPKGQEGDDRFGEEVRRLLAIDFPELPVVMLSAKKQQELINHDVPYLSKLGLSTQDIILTLVRHARLHRDQQRSLLRLPDTIVAEDPAGMAMFREAFCAANTDIAVLILGETGTGKDVLARYIHECSRRAIMPYIPVNVAAIPADLVETELFGHEKGSFTGAERKHPGLFVQADGGTIFLDEIGDMTPALQAKMLRVLQDGEVLPVGSVTPMHVDVRILTATSRDLAGMIKEGSFREDLVRRISGVTLKIPALRQRRLDIAPLSGFFLARFSEAQGKNGITFSPDALTILFQHPFVGNVGELQHIVQGLVNRKGNYSIISTTDVLEALAGSFVSSVNAARPPMPDANKPPLAASGSLAELARLISLWPVPIDDPLLHGGKPHLEKSFHLLLRRMAGAALERFRDPRNGALNRQAATQFLTGDPSLKGKGPGRFINVILNRKADTAISDDDLDQLVQEWRRHS